MKGEIWRRNKLRVVQMVTRKGGGGGWMREMLVQDTGQKVHD